MGEQASAGRQPVDPGHARPLILAGIDGGAGSASVLRAAARLAELARASLLIAHVVEAPQLGSQGYVGIDNATLTEIEVDLFPEVVEALAESAVSWKLMTLTGNPASELARTAAEHTVSAIVVGADTPGWTSHLRRLSSGSVPTRLAHEQGAPVVIVPGGCSRLRSREEPTSTQR